ncbi:hypothetical protein HY494_00350 [Candidatus Woesearchaeota archaeon]|nr:hypothetical protein [Candidatus Woesearchaeota archaeon]
MSTIALDDERILSGDVSDAERLDLEQRLLGMLLSRAKKQGAEIVIVTDQKVYESLMLSGEAFRQGGSRYYLLMDEARSQILDTTPLALQLMNTPEGLFYAKIIVHSANHPS